jgi:positive regulator of sigma E activity
MRNSSLLAMEIIWIATGVFCIVAAIKVSFTGGGNKIIIFVLMALIAFTFAWLRHKQRKKS